ncbi:G- coupled receptor GRL101-like [Paramuricea clavata]|uniref:G- coupled receptor GRL101-like n=1 Tax=Paramuricea clavata TaxID=317549 RepID=A0A6S7IVB5_PARCT|nr:G- coupled receptor GRL101-like [Paramuricea clavata]
MCMTFTYRLLGKGPELDISVEPKNMNKEQLWLVKDSQNDTIWKTGQVSLGLVTEFRVHIKATQRYKSEVNIDNIFFMEGYCDPVPANAQEWRTSISDSSSGYITSPYYPTLYLNNMKRNWRIEVPDGQRLKLDWSYLNLEHHKQCKSDSVIIKDSRRSRTSTSFCGYELPPTYLAPGNKVIVGFQSDETNVGTGFKLHYQAIPADFFDDSCENKEVSDCHPMVQCSYIRSNKSKVFVEALDLMIIPEYFPALTTAIDFHDNFLIKLGAYCFENLTQLEYLGEDSTSKYKLTLSQNIRHI